MAKMKELQATQRKVRLTGIADIMFDRYAGDNKTQLDVADKFYFGEDGKSLVLPSMNVMSLMTAQNTASAPKRFCDVRKANRTAQAILSSIAISPFLIPITRDGKPLAFHGFDGNDEDKASGAYVHRCVARLPKGIPNPKVRPVIRAPWELAFDLTIFPSDEVNEYEIKSLMEKAGVGIGLGTFRGVFGKFLVDRWE